MNVNVVVDIEELGLIDILGMLLGGGPEDHHWHLCERCCHIWDHDRPRNVNKRAYDKAHCCPECKSGPYRTAWPELPSKLNVT